MFHQVFTFSPILLPLQHVEGLNFKMSTELKGEEKKQHLLVTGPIAQH